MLHMDKSVCPGRDYLAFLDPQTGRVTLRGIARFAVNMVIGWVIIVIIVGVLMALA